MANDKEIQAALGMMKAVADCVRELGSVPSGHLYVMTGLDLPKYDKIIGLLKQARLVTESRAHLLTWAGK